MGNLYCTNCGTESSKKICSNCGVKRNSVHKYCAYCGAELTPNASICTSCQEPIKGEPIFWNILNIVIAVLLFSILSMALDEGQPILVIICLALSLVLCLPIIKSIIKKFTIGKLGLRKILKLARNVAIVLFFVVGMTNLVEVENNVEMKVYKNEATDKALEVFHNEVQLKNEASFVLNDSSVTYVDSYNGNDNLALVTVILDYSAENGFGGTNRDTYTVQLIFNYESGTYRKAN